MLDASALVDWLLGTSSRDAIADQIRRARFPQTLDFAYLEVISALRAKITRGELDPERAELALQDLEVTPLHRHRAAPLARRVWALRATLTPYDAAYVALAEALRAPLVTTDSRLARSRGHRATIVHAAA